MTNKYTAEVPFKLGDKTVTICYDYRAISELQSELGLKILEDIFRDPSPELVCKMLAFGVRKHNPEIGVEQIEAVSPPIMLALAAIDAALTYAYYGPDGPPPLSLGVVPEKKS